MKDFSKATPRPWRTNKDKNNLPTIVAGYGRGQRQLICDLDLEPYTGAKSSIGVDERINNAELIVTAVNNFDDLSKFLRMVNDCLNDGIPIEKNDPVHNVAKQLLESLK